MTSSPDLTACTLLLVDDEEANLDLLEDLLGRKGYRSLVRASDARQAIPAFRACAPDLVLLDLHMPHRSGFEVLEELRGLTPADDYLPVLVLTADVTFAAKQRALAGGAHDFVTKPFVNAEVLLRVRNLLHTRALYREQARARAAAEGAERRARVLAEASRLLGGSFDNATALAQLAALLARDLADGCAIDLHVDGAPRRVAGRDAGGPIRLEAPLASRGAELGRITLTRDGAGPPFDAEEQALAHELGRRAALAVENARLFADARAAAEARDRVLAVVAHDLRTPLAALQMDTEMLGEHLASEARHGRALQRMHRSVVRMDGLIQDLLDAARVDAGRLALELRERPAGELLAEAAETLRPLADAASVALHVVPGDGDAVPLHVDDGRILQVICNLVGNALKFTPAGGAVSLASELREGECWISVQDTGPGVAPEEIPHLFTAFWQARDADRRGVGLGLAIARSVVVAHGGRIWVESEPGRGTRFTFALSAAPAAVSDAVPKPLAPTAAAADAALPL